MKISQVAEALHEQIADLSSLVAELKEEGLHSFVEDLRGRPGLGLGLDGLPLSSQELKRGSGVEDNGSTVPPHSDSQVSGRKSVSVRNSSGGSVRNSFAEVGA